MRACPSQLWLFFRRCTSIFGRRGSCLFAFILPLLAAMMYFVFSPLPVRGVSSDIVISQVYGGGGNSGATFKNDFIELFNRGNTTVSMTGWSVQYASSSGTTWQVTTLTGSLAPGQYYLIQEAGGATGSSLPTADKSDTINLSATAGKVALVNNTTALSGSCPSGASIIDFVGYGSSANCFEGSGPTPNLSNNTVAALRAMNGCQDTDQNATDFTASLANPRNTASPTNVCGAPTNPTGVGAANPNPISVSGSTLLTVNVTPGTNPTSTGLVVTGDLTAIGGLAAQQFFDDGVNGGDATLGDGIFSFQATVSMSTAPGLKNLPITVTDDRSRSSSTSIALTVQVPTPPGDIAISQVYGGGGNTGAIFKNDFIELFNRGNTTVNITGWSVQYASSSGTTWQVTALSGSLAPGQYYLIQENQGSGGTADLPTPDAMGNIAMTAGAGKVALVNTTTALSGNCPLGSSVLDFVGYGGANCFEGSGPTATLSNTIAGLRRKSGCQDTNDNTADFVTGAPNPRNTASPFHSCSDRADLETTKNGPVNVLASGAISYTITTVNHGPNTATNVIITDTLPSGLTNVNVSDGGTLSGNTITWPTIANLAKDASVTFTVTANAPKTASSLLNTARSESDTDDQNTNNNSSSVTTTVLAGSKFDPNGVGTKLSDPAICIEAGDVLAVEAKFTNTGFTPQGNNTGPEFVAMLPSQLLAVAGSCVASSGTCSLVGSSQIQWNGTVGVNETVTINYRVQIKNGTPPGIPLCIVSTVNYDSNNDGTNDAMTSITVCTEVNCPRLGPGDALPAQAIVSDQKPGSVLIYNLYSSNAIAPQTENTRINITNTHQARTAIVHLFFMDDDSASVADAFICLTPNQTMSFLASDIDPGTAGYIVAIASDDASGCPINFNFLIGDEYVKLSSGHRANLSAEAFAALAGAPVDCTATAITAEIAFDGKSYDLAPRVVAVDNLPSPADGNSTLLVIQHIGGSLVTGASTLGEINGLLFDDTEQSFSFDFDASQRQLRRVISNTFPRTTPRFSTLISSGRSGWLRLWRVTDGALLGAVLNFNTNPASPLTGGHNLHYLTLTDSASFTIPIFPPPCL